VTASKKWAWALCGAYACVILTLTSLPVEEIPLTGEIDVSDLVAHAAMYTILALLVFRALTISYRHWALFTLAVYVFVTVAGFGAVDELHQYPIPYRTCEFPDWLADVAGSLIGALLSLLYVAWFAKPLRKPSEV